MRSLSQSYTSIYHQLARHYNTRHFCLLPPWSILLQMPLCIPLKSLKTWGFIRSEYEHENRYWKTVAGPLCFTIETYEPSAETYYRMLERNSFMRLFRPDWYAPMHAWFYFRKSFDLRLIYKQFKILQHIL